MLFTLATASDHHRGYLPVTPGTLASGRACIGHLSSSFLAPQTLQTRWSATSGTGNRFGNPSDRGSFLPTLQVRSQWYPHHTTRPAPISHNDMITAAPPQ